MEWLDQILIGIGCKIDPKKVCGRPDRLEGFAPEELELIEWAPGIKRYARVERGVDYIEFEQEPTVDFRAILAAQLEQKRAAEMELESRVDPSPTLPRKVDTGENTSLLIKSEEGRGGLPYLPKFKSQR